jgi:hypothetical protein
MLFVSQNTFTIPFSALLREYRKKKGLKIAEMLRNNKSVS